MFAPSLAKMTAIIACRQHYLTFKDCKIMKKRLRFVRQLMNRRMIKLLLLMKISTLAILVFSLQSFALNTRAQERINLQLKDANFETVIKTIEKHSSYSFVYQYEILPKNFKISVYAKDATLKYVMQEVLQNTNLTYKLLAKNLVVLLNKDDRNQEAPAPGWVLHGKVLDENAQPIVSASVFIKGTETGTATDMEGKFMLEVNAPQDSLVVTSVGFKTKTVVVGNVREIVIHLEQDVKQQKLDEIVVVGFGTQKKESVIGAITTISPEKLQTNQTRALSNALVGQIAGIIGVKRSGEPGYDESDIWIRGINTFGVNSTPLIIVDGIQRSLDNIAPEEIASFSVLKDATATAIYGVRGANGAIVIKTKRGAIGKPKVSLNADYGISSPIKLPEYADGATQMEIINAARKLSGGTDFISQGRIDSTRQHLDPDLYPDVNWIDQVTEKYATNDRINLDINGGTDRLRYRFIVGMFEEKGIIKTDPAVNYDSKLRLQRYNVRSNIDMDLTSSTLLSVSIGGYIINRNAPGTSPTTILDWSMQTPPIVHPAVYSTGQFPKNVNRANPWVQATQTGYVKNYQNSLQSSVSLEQNFGKLSKPLTGLTVKALFSFDAYNWHNINRTKQPSFYMATGRDEEGNLLFNLVETGQEFLGFSKSAGGNRNMYFELPVSYNRTFGAHSVSGLLLYNRNDYVNVDVSSAIMSFPYRNQGLAGRFTYDYNKRYFGEFNFGYNGSENFAEGYRYGFFPSFALGWMISNEKFMSDVTFIDNLKLRGSWGRVGNDKISDSRRFGYVTTINSSTGYKWGWTSQLQYSGVQEGDFGIPNLTWETATKTDIGIDVQILKSLSIQFDLFKEQRTNIFMLRKTVPELAGYINTPYANYGKVDNRGFDTNIEFSKQIGKDFSLSVLANITHAKNKILEYDEPTGLIGTNRSRTNYNINQSFGLIADGLYTENDFLDPVNGTLKPEVPQSLFGKVLPGDIKYIDVNGDGKVGADDEVPIGKPTIPETVYGFGFSLRYKNFDLGCLFQGIANVAFIISGNEMIPGSGDGSIGNILTNANDRWTPEDPRQDVFYPRLSRSKSENNNRASTWWLKDGAFMRLKHFEIGYTLIKEKYKRLPLSNARVFLRGSDLLTFSSFKLWDPELAGTGYSSYPSSRIASVGFNVTF